MMKRCLSALVCLSMALMLLPMTALAAPQSIVPRDGVLAGDWVTVEGVVGGQLRFDAATGSITAADATITQAHIPDTINGTPVTAIGDRAFAFAADLTSVTLPDAVTSIGIGAFVSCSALRSITLSAALQSIGVSAFNDCTALTRLTLPAALQTIGIPGSPLNLFYQCAALTAIDVDAANPYFTSQNGVLFNDDCTTLIAYPCARRGAYTIPGTVNTIGLSSFQDCVGLTGVTIPDGVTEIQTQAFDGCIGLSDITLPASVLSFAAGVFDHCAGLTAIHADPANLNYTSVDGVLFDKSCTELVQYPVGRAGAYTIPSTVNTIGSFAFRDCAGLTDITIPNGVRDIGSSAFAKCSALTSVTLPATVQSIGSLPFDLCSKLTAIHVDANNANYASIDGVVFNKACTELLLCPNGRTGTYTIPDGVASIAWGAFYNCAKLTGVTIPDSVLSIAAFAFTGCSGLTDISLPASVNSIGECAFLLCSGLTDIDVDAANGSYASSDGVLLDKAGTTLITFPGGREGVYTVPDGVSVIGKSAFLSCEKITGVKLPATVTELKDGAFGDCFNLKSVGFAGPVPRFEDAPGLSYSDIFRYHHAALTLYYIDGQAGWTTPHWDVYKTALWDGQELPIPPDPPAATASGAFGPGEADHGIEYGLKGALIWLPDGRLQCTVDAARTKYVSTSIDNIPLETGDVTLTEGSTVVTISAARVAKLKDGAHTLRVQFTDGRAETTFTTPHDGEMLTANAASVPATGEAPVGGAFAWAALALLLMGMGMTKVKNEY